jgi:phosphatidylserine decarboxylase
VLLHIRYRGPNRHRLLGHFKKGEEMGWFQHGSTIIVFAPKGFSLSPGIAQGQCIAMGEALLQLPK